MGTVKHRYHYLFPICLKTKMDTPCKQPEISTMTREQEEEMKHDISKLQDQVQKISLL